MGKCMFQGTEDAEPFAFEFLCDTGNAVNAIYWENTDKCRGANDLEMDDYYCSAPADVSGQECECIGRGRACDTFTIKMKKDSECENTEDQSTSIVVNECIKTGYGSSEYMQCDDTLLQITTYPECDDCSCAGETVTKQFDYSWLSENHCFEVECSEGARKIKRCKDRGMNAVKNRDIELNINTIDGIDKLQKHIENHHLFVQDIITKQVLTKNNHNMLYIYGGISVVVIVVFIAFIVWFKRYREYAKI